ncbi:zinc finger protein 2-like [Bradysia coprophila]|uniref:zinc finger protein 2-like n=1 Tax=Bradysia coprophila TaxID=38358 RepID=UPI00187D97FA|nr:zinc finger protein 2-like [Bradysia coprophila]
MSTGRSPKLPKISIQDVEVIKPANQLSMKLPGNSTAAKRMKLNNSTSAQLRSPSIMLNATINLNRSASSSVKNVHRTSEDFFLKNENNCFYKCVLCSETVNSKPSYKNHMRTIHDTDLGRYYIQRGFVDATKEFCTEFVQTDFNIIQSLTSIFDQIDNIGRIIRDHKKRFRCADHDVENGITDAFVNDEVVVLKLCGEMIQRASNILMEKNELITCLQEEVAELVQQDFNHSGTENHQNDNRQDENQFGEEIVKEEEEPVYELYYIEDDVNDINQQQSDPSKVEEINSTPSTASKRGRPKGDLARTLNDCLSELPEATAEYIRSMTPNRDSKYQCNMCDVSGKTKMLLCVHYLRVHLKRKDKICPHCDRGFASQGDLTRHIRIHSGDCPFKCDYQDCTSEFKTSGDLKKHKIVHERDRLDRPFECSECTSKFVRQTDLTRHKKIHLLGKVDNVGFKCELCSKVFYRKDLFRAHSNHHLKLKPFECDRCQKRFAKKYDLLKHRDKEHKAVNCDECGKCFESRAKLIEHFNSGMCKDAKSGSMK